jgi:6-phosphogluconate dehydrogenase
MRNKSVIPSIPVVLPTTEQNSVVTDEQLIEIYGEILEDLRNDRKEVDAMLSNFVEMVMNEGDSTSSSKEALVNLAKLKSEIAIGKSKIADLMTSLKLKEKQASKINATQNNNITITDRRNLIETINKLTNNKGDKDAESDQSATLADE